jgi:hypothetical protein
MPILLVFGFFGLSALFILSSYYYRLGGSRSKWVDSLFLLACRGWGSCYNICYGFGSELFLSFVLLLGSLYDFCGGVECELGCGCVLIYVCCFGFSSGGVECGFLWRRFTLLFLWVLRQRCRLSFLNRFRFCLRIFVIFKEVVLKMREILTHSI